MSAQGMAQKPASACHVELWIKLCFIDGFVVLSSAMPARHAKRNAAQ
jgi:hypothetical protein